MTDLHLSTATQTQSRRAARGRMAGVAVQAGVGTKLNPRGPS
jgi:hypothetical protein